MISLGVVEKWWLWCTGGCGVQHQLRVGVWHGYRNSAEKIRRPPHLADQDEVTQRGAKRTTLYFVLPLDN